MLAAALSGRLNIGGCTWDAQLFPSSIMVALLSVLPEQSLLQHTISTEKFPISKKRCRFPSGSPQRSSFNFLRIPLDILCSSSIVPARSCASIQQQISVRSAVYGINHAAPAIPALAYVRCRIPMQSFKSFINTLFPEKDASRR